MSNSTLITPSYLSKICKVMKSHGVRRVTMQGLQIVMQHPENTEEMLESLTKEPNPMKDEAIQPPSTLDELDKLVDLSAFEAFDNE